MFYAGENVRLFVKCSNFRPLANALIVTNFRLLAVSTGGAASVEFAVGLSELGPLEPDEKRRRLTVSGPQGSQTFKSIPRKDIPVLMDHLQADPQTADNAQWNQLGNPPPQSLGGPHAAAAPPSPPSGHLVSASSSTGVAAPSIPEQTSPPALPGKPILREKPADRASFEAAAVRGFRAVLAAIPDAAARMAAPPRVDGPAGVIRLPGDGRQRVVGERYYQPAFHAICRGRKVPRAGDEGCWEESAAVTARLVAEHDNPHDRNAVRVDVQGKRVGHLPREDAPMLHPLLAEIQKEGKVAECEGRIVIAGTGDYSMYLHLSDPGAVSFALQRGDDEVFIDGSWTAQVLGEEAHQDFLRKLASTIGREQVIAATLAFCTVKKGKYSGQRAIEVRILGHRVGELSRPMSDRYAGRVEEILAAGKVPVCRAVLRAAKEKGIQVTLQVPRVERPLTMPVHHEFDRGKKH